MNKATVRSARIFSFVFIATLALVSQAAAATPACVGGPSLSGWYGMLVGGSADAGGGKYLSGALHFDGACGITATNVSGGAGAQYVTTSATGTYGQNSDGTFTITLNLTGQTPAQTYIVGVSESGTKARGIEYDNTASATIDLQSQFTSLTGGYNTASLAGTYAVACSQGGGGNVDLNYVTFDGKGNISGVDDYSHGTLLASATYTGTYTVNTDGTFSGALAGGYSAFTLTGVIDGGINEIDYTYNQSGQGGIESCTGKVSTSTALSGYYGLLVAGSNVGAGGGGKYLSGTLFFNGSGGITATNLNGGTTSLVNSTGTGTYTVNSDNTVTINLTLSGTTTAQTYIVGVAQGGAEALGVEYDGAADATVDLQAQLEPSTLPYSTASLNTTYAVTCTGSEVDLNYVSFDGNGNLAGIDPYASTGSQGDAPYTGTYSVKSDGTISSSLAGNYSSFSFTGVIDNWTSEIAYTYEETGNGQVVGCIGESTYGPIGTATVAATPTFSPAPGSFTGTQSVTLADTTSGAKIYYTTNGVPPTVESKVYSGPISVTGTTTILAIAAAGGFNNSAIGGGTYFFGSSGTQTAATPTFSPGPGSYSTTQTVTLSDTTSGAVIHCTTDGSTPTASSPVCTSVTISTTTTLQAIAVATGYTNSNIASGVYTIGATQTAATPTFSPAPGTYSTTQTVTLSDTTSGAVIHCTTDGSTPTASSPVCTTLTVSATTTINAIAVATGYNNSAIATGVYTISSSSNGTVVNLSSYYNIYGIATQGSVPKNGGFDNDGYAYNSSLLGNSLTYQGLTFPLAAANGLDAIVAQTFPVPQAQYSQLYLLGAGTNGAQTNQSIIAYYTDGSSSTLTQSFSDWTIPQNYSGETTVIQMANRITPTGGTQNGTIDVYGYTLALNASKTLAALKLPFNRNVVFLGVGLAGGSTITATPTFSPAPGTYSSTQTVILSDTTPGAVIYYNINGGNTSQYTAPITVSSSETLYAVAAANGYSLSALATGVYTITQSAATPTFSPAPGNYTSAQKITLSDTTSGATIYYTTNGTPPTTSSTKYTGPFTVSATTTVEAIAVASGYNNSAIATGIYTIQSYLINNGTYYITSVNSGLAIDDPGFSTQLGKDMQQYTLNKGTNQQWTVTNLGNNIITLTNGSSGLFLEVAGASKSNSALVDQWSNLGNTAQRWNVIALSGGAFELVNVNSGLCLDVTGGSKNVGALLDQYPYKGNAWQQWKFASK